MLLWFLFALNPPPDLVFKSSFPVLPYIKSVVFGDGSGNTFWIADRYAGWVRHYDSDGTELKRIHYGTGAGPGELQTPRNILAFPEKNRLIVGCRYGATHAFAYDTGLFLEKIFSFMPSSGMHVWGPDSLIVIWGKDGQRRDAFLIFDDNGEPIESWPVPQPKWQEEYLYDAPRGYAVGRKTVFLGYMAKPEIRIYPYRERSPRYWPLFRPAGYIEPPERKLKKEEMFDRGKVTEYMESFTFIENIFLVGEQYLLVVWHHVNARPQSLDLYRLSDKKRVVSDLKIDGRVLGVTEDTIISLLELSDQTQALAIFEVVE